MPSSAMEAPRPAGEASHSQKAPPSPLQPLPSRWSCVDTRLRQAWRECHPTSAHPDAHTRFGEGGFLLVERPASALDRHVAVPASMRPGAKQGGTGPATSVRGALDLGGRGTRSGSAAAPTEQAPQAASPPAAPSLLLPPAAPLEEPASPAAAGPPAGPQAASGEGLAGTGSVQQSAGLRQQLGGSFVTLHLKHPRKVVRATPRVWTSLLLFPDPAHRRKGRMGS